MLIYGCVSIPALKPLVLLQKKLTDSFCSRNTEMKLNFFENCKVLTAHKIHIYELLKFETKSVYKMHTDTYLNELFSFEFRSNNLTRSLQWFLKIPKCKRKFERNSMRYRGANLLNLFLLKTMCYYQTIMSFLVVRLSLRCTRLEITTFIEL